jgi:hypothetical protein
MILGVVVAVLVGAALVAAGAVHLGGPSGSGAQMRAIQLPERLGMFEDQIVVDRQHGSAANTASLALQEDHTAQLTVAAYQRAYPGAAAAFRAYANSTLELLPDVVAVRAPTPGLTVGPVADPADLGLAMDMSTVESFGDVSCVVYTEEQTLAGHPVPPSSLTYGQCLRSGPHLSVFVWGGGFDGNSGRTAIVALTDAAYNAVAGS